MARFWPRFTRRRMILLVALAAPLGWAGVRYGPWGLSMWERSAASRNLADLLQDNQRSDLDVADKLEQIARDIRKGAEPGDDYRRWEADEKAREADYFRTRMLEYHRDMERWYRQIAARPWDGPGPKPKTPRFAPERRPRPKPAAP